MSWEATAYVKNLGKDKLTRAEKAVFIYLAEAHNTHQRAAWPSIRLLAELSLFEQRHVRRILQSLESKGQIVRLIPDRQGRGSITQYAIPAVDWREIRKGDMVSTFKKSTRGTFRKPKGDISAPAIRNELKALTKPINGNPDCSQCRGTGQHKSISIPGKTVTCECVEVA